MSGMIFVGLAIGWAVYLLPKALKRNEDADRRRPVEEFSDKLRVLGRGATPAPVVTPSATPDVALRDGAGAPPQGPSRITREAARSAARRRRRVLALLLSTLVAVAITSALAYTPWFTTAIPAALVVAFLVVARLTVRAQQVRPVAPVQRVSDVALRDGAGAPPQGPVVDEDETEGIAREELAQALANPVLDEGGLWDPLPVTLPTYVNKPRARRTVRTIELTAGATGITSSGHDAADSALAAEAAAVERDSVEADEVIEAQKAAGA